MIYGSDDIMKELERNAALLEEVFYEYDETYWNGFFKYNDQFSTDYPVWGSYHEYVKTFHRAASAIGSVANEIVNNVVALSTINPSDFYSGKWLTLNEEVGAEFYPGNNTPIPELMTPPKQGTISYSRKGIVEKDIAELKSRVAYLKKFLSANTSFSTATRTNNQKIHALRYLAMSFGHFATKRFGYAWCPSNGMNSVGGGLGLAFTIKAPITLSGGTYSYNEFMENVLGVPADAIFDSYGMTICFSKKDSNGNYVVYMTLALNSPYYHGEGIYDCLMFRRRKKTNRPTSSYKGVLHSVDTNVSLFYSYAGVRHFNESISDVSDISPQTFLDAAGDMIEFSYTPSIIAANKKPLSNVASSALIKFPVSPASITQEGGYGGHVVRPALYDFATEVPVGEELAEDDVRNVLGPLICSVPWKILGHRVRLNSGGSDMNLHIGKAFNGENEIYCPMLVMATHSNWIRENAPQLIPYEEYLTDNEMMYRLYGNNILFRKSWHAYGPWQT